MQQAHQLLVSLSVQNSAVVANFFIKLGFTELYPPVIDSSRLFSDGHLQIQLTASEKWHSGIVLFTEQPLDGLAAALQLTGVQTVVQDNKIRMVAPDGLALYWIHLKDYDFPKQPPSGKTLCGAFYELSLEVDDLEASKLFWESVGFEKKLPEGDLSNWLTMSNKLLNIGLYEKGSCPYPFRSPALSWFNKDAKQILMGLRQAGFDFAFVLPTEAGEPEEAILESPEGQHLFLFKAW